ncbi:uncharacterized protein LOC131935424 [Physella acuta]|uniref:uncharacterized protein LOC131935424 n=1 Tax=Physella acuta TaxID=109671 RepID=UPI0027DE2BFA|nr:uncharacterized protein LOC131935424 [Physella acuta]
MMMLCLVILLAVGHVCAVEPGFKLRITNKGLNYAKDLMVRYLQESSNDFLPAQIEGVNNIAQWSLQNIRYKNFTVGDSSLRLNPRFLTLTLQDVAVESSMDGLLSRDAL